MTIKICAYKNCNKEFTTNLIKQKFCSIECREAKKLIWYRERRVFRKEFNQCSNCGLLLINNKNRHCDICKQYNINNSKKARKQLKQTNKCESCHKIIDTDSTSSIYCRSCSINRAISLRQKTLLLKNNKICVSCRKNPIRSGVCCDNCSLQRSKNNKIKYNIEKQQVLDHYNNICSCCNITIKEFLTVDHINGGGKAHRKSIGGAIYKWLIKNKFPSGFQLLCYNCNFAKGHYIVCPHIKDEEFISDRLTSGVKHNRRLKIKIMTYYGNKCVCCLENNIKFLSIDHINGSGRKHTQSINSSLYRWLYNNNYPEGYQVLCFNCNCSKGMGGFCPHKKLNKNEEMND